MVIKRLYFPGLISLVFLPLMCIGYLLYAGKFQKLYMLDIAWAGDKFAKYLTNSTGIDYKTHRNYQDLRLTGDENQDSRSLIKLQQKIKALETSSDTINGYSITFTQRTKYVNVVQALDIGMNVEPSKMGLLILNDQVLIWKLNKHAGYKLAVAHKPLFICGFQQVCTPPKTVFENIGSIAGILKKDFLIDNERVWAFWIASVILLAMIAMAISGKTKCLIFNNI